MKRIFSIALFVMVLTCISFQKKWDAYPLPAKEYIERRLEHIRRSQWEQCRKRANEEARRRVDQYLISQGVFYQEDSIPLRPKPAKPELPAFRPVPDSGEVEPILKDTGDHRKLLKKG